MRIPRLMASSKIKLFHIDDPLKLIMDSYVFYFPSITWVKLYLHFMES